MVRLGIRHLLIAVCLAPHAVTAQIPAGRGERGERGGADDSALVVIGHAGLPADSVTRAQLRRIFLARQRFWPGGLRIQAVNLPAATAVRERFSRAALGRGSRELAGYWADLYFHGTQPPPVLASERAVLLFVERTPGAVGYLRAAALAALLPARVKRLLVLGP